MKTTPTAFLHTLFALTTFALTAGAAHAQTATFNFDDLAVGTKTTIQQNHNGLGVQFSQIGNSPFTVGPAGTAPLFAGHSLGVGPGNNGLEVLFFEPIYSVSINFAAAGFSTSPDSVRLSSFGLLGPASPDGPSDTEAGSVYASVPLGASSYNLVNGTLSITSKTPLGGLFLTDANQTGFSLDNFTLNASPIPETSSVMSFGLLLSLGAGAWIVRRKRTPAAV